jgi:hypothetical protein
MTVTASAAQRMSASKIALKLLTFHDHNDYCDHDHRNGRAAAFSISTARAA